MPNEKNLNTIPVGTLGLIPLESCALREVMHNLLHFTSLNTARTATLSKQRILASVPVKQRALSRNPSAAAICILWWMFVTIAKRILCADM